MIWKIMWAIIPLLGIMIISTWSLQTHHNSIKSIQQFTNNNIMFLSWIVLVIGGIWMMHIWWYEPLFAMIILSIGTIIWYYIILACRYEDWMIVWHQTSVTSALLVFIITIVSIIYQPVVTQQYLGTLSTYLIISTTIMVLYWLFIPMIKWLIPAHTRDETITLAWVITPSCIIMTLCSTHLIIWLLWIMIWYRCYGWALRKLNQYHYPTDYNQKERTIELILKWYKTSYLSHYMKQRSRVNIIFETIQNLWNPNRIIIEQRPSVIIIWSYTYMITKIITWGITVSDFIIYCIIYIGYVFLWWLYKLNDGKLQIDTLSLSFIIWYLNIITIIIIWFAGDLITGSIIGVIWIIANALLVTQYHNLNFKKYILKHHVKRWVWANTITAWLCIIIIIQLPIDWVMITPITLIITAILWITITQSYNTLRKL